MMPASTALVHVPRPCFYRYQEALYSHDRLFLVLHRYPVLHPTAKGTVIDVHGVPKFVLSTATKRYACPTPDEALASYHARKRAQVRILARQLARAQAALQLTGEGASMSWYEPDDLVLAPMTPVPPV